MQSELNQANKWNEQLTEIERLRAINIELLKALKACLSYMTDADSSDVTGSIALAQIRTALAKAGA